MVKKLKISDGHGGTFTPTMIVDLDNTITQANYWWTGDITPPRLEAIKTLREYHEKGWNITIFTARHWACYENIISYLTYYGIPFDNVICGKPLGLIYVDDRATGFDGDWDMARKHLAIVESRVLTTKEEEE